MNFFQKTRNDIENRRQKMLRSGKRIEAPWKEGGEVELGKLCRRAALPAPRCRLLYHIVLEAPEGALLELGTNVGIGTAYMVAAAREKGAGPVVSVEGVPDIRAAALRTLRATGTAHGCLTLLGDFDVVLDFLIATEQEFTFVFLDGSHDHVSTIGYMNKIVQIVPSGGKILLDDCSQNDMEKAWGDLQQDPRFCLPKSDGRFGQLTRA